MFFLSEHELDIGGDGRGRVRGDEGKKIVNRRALENERNVLVKECAAIAIILRE